MLTTRNYPLYALVLTHIGCFFAQFDDVEFSGPVKSISDVVL